MKKLLFVVVFLFFSAAWGSEYCKQNAQQVMEVREDYKSFAEVEADITVGMARTFGLTGEHYAVEVTRLKMLRLHAQEAFFHSSGAKGARLYKKAYESCIAYENAQTARGAKQAARAAREAAKAAKAEKAVE